MTQSRTTPQRVATVDGFAAIQEGRDMMVRFSDKEAAVLLGATLMHWGVPFRRSPRRALTEEQQSIVDEASEKLISLRETCRRTQGQETQEVALSDQEAALLIAVAEDCLNECGDDPTELNLQLKMAKREEVVELLDRLRSSLGASRETRLKKLVEPGNQPALGARFR
jgi:non-homologous end joining protein Ku